MLAECSDSCPGFYATSRLWRGEPVQPQVCVAQLLAVLALEQGHAKGYAIEGSAAYLAPCVFEVFRYSCIVCSINADRGASQNLQAIVSTVSAHSNETMVPSHLTNMLKLKRQSSKKSSTNKFVL